MVTYYLTKIVGHLKPPTAIVLRWVEVSGGFLLLGGLVLSSWRSLWGSTKGINRGAWLRPARRLSPGSGDAVMVHLWIV